MQARGIYMLMFERDGNIITIPPSTLKEASRIIGVLYKGGNSVKAVGKNSLYAQTIVFLSGGRNDR
jgi:hypothetical protein